MVLFGYKWSYGDRLAEGRRKMVLFFIKRSHGNRYAKNLNILVRRSRQSGVARATNPDFESHRLLLILLVSDLNHILLA